MNTAAGIEEGKPEKSVVWLPLVLCIGLALIVARVRLGEALYHPSQYLIGGFTHPDTIGNHWLLVWVADQLLGGNTLLHNSSYYVPVGDYPWLAGNGSEGLLYAVFHSFLGWPTAVMPLVLVYFFGLSLGMYGLARRFGVGVWGSVLSSQILLGSGLWARELEAGRFTQLDAMWLLFSMLLFMGLLQEKRSKPWLVGCGLCVAGTALFYWYYAYFFVLFAVVSVTSAWIGSRHVEWRQVWIAALSSMIFVSPIAWIFWENWEHIVGVEQAVYPPIELISDSLALSVSWWRPVGRFSGVVHSIPTWGLMGVAGLSLFRTGQISWKHWMLCCLSIGFLLLSFGVNTPIFEGVYGWCAPLRRFWWPSRHLLIWNVGCSIAAGMGADVLLKWVPVLKRSSVVGPLVFVFGIASLNLFSLWMQDERYLDRAHTAIQFPIPVYQDIGNLEGDALMMPPINPKIANSQLPLFYQLSHQKRLFTGHALWVDRVRPRAWDTFVSTSRVLSTLSAFELGQHSAKIPIQEEDMRVLWENGIDLVVLDATLFPPKLSGLVPHLAEVYTDLWGEPIYRAQGLRVWSTQNWTGLELLSLPAWTLPYGFQLGDGAQSNLYPVQGRGIEVP